MVLCIEIMFKKSNKLKKILDISIKVVLPSIILFFAVFYLIDISTHIINFYNNTIKVRIIITAIYSAMFIFSAVITNKIYKYNFIKKQENIINQFISTLNHELRTPLTAIAGSLKIILSGFVGKIPVAMEEMLNLANDNSVRLLEKITTLLDFEKIKASQFEFNEYEIVELINQYLISNKNYADLYNTKYNLITKIEKAYVNIDKDKLFQILQTLLLNVAKSSDKHSIIDVIIEKMDTYIRISIVEKSAIEFGETEDITLKQADDSAASQKCDNKTNLYISKYLIEKMNGRINFDSSENEETTFYIEIPELVRLK